MAADAEVIKEFLVSLGFKVDKTSEKNFTGALSKTGDVAMQLGKRVRDVAIAAEVMVTTFAFQMEKLYYSSRRTGASVENIKGLENGFSRIGLKADDARQALEGMAAAVRMNPGLRGMMNMLTGKDTGKMDQSEAMLELVQALSKMPHYQGEQYANMFGIDEKTFLMLKDGMPELVKSQREYRELAREMGVDLDAAADASKEYANGVRDITTRVDLLWKKLSIEMLPVLKEVHSWIVKALDGLLELTKADLKSVVNDMGKGAADMASEGFTIGQADVDAQEAHEKEQQRLSAESRRTRAARAAKRAQAAESASSRARGLRNNNPGNLNFAGQAGATLESGPNARFARFRTMREGLQAMAGQLMIYGSRGIDTVRKIISNWAPTGDKNDTNSYISTVSNQLGVNPNQRLNLRNPQVLASLMSSITRHENGYNPIGSSEMLAAAQARLGRGGVNINQQTVINVNGNDSPADTARRVASEQGRVNSNMTRNMRGAAV